MKNIISTITIVSIMAASSIVVPTEAIAQTPITVKFYCGQTFDSDSNKIIPTTLIATSARKEPVAIVQWKSKLSGKQTPQSRCNIVSAKFQQAWEAKRLNYLVSGVDKNSGLGIICGVKDKATPCNKETMLFTLVNGADATATIDRIKNIKSGSASNPIYQSSGESIVDIQSMIN
jgi:Circadian oscillating protein COP23